VAGPTRTISIATFDLTGLAEYAELPKEMGSVVGGGVLVFTWSVPAPVLAPNPACAA